jgi:hypothetical protein
MSFFQEYALLFVVATPVAVVVLMQVALWLSGERDTLLLPVLTRYPSVWSEAEIAKRAPHAQAIEPVPQEELATALADTPAGVSEASANESLVRKAA